VIVVTFATGADKGREAVGLLMRVAQGVLDAPFTEGAKAVDNAFATLDEQWQKLKRLFGAEGQKDRWSNLGKLSELGDANQLVQRFSRLVERALILRELELKATAAVAGRGDSAAFVISTLLDLLPTALESEDPSVVAAAGADLERRLMDLFSS
jgi:hypothetical protein